MKRVISLALFVLIIVGSLTVPAAAATEASGTWGGLEWTLDAEGTLTISGEGNMDYVNSDDVWRQYSGEIKSVVINDGVTSIADHAFYQCTSLTSVNIATSVTSIGNGAFAYCIALTDIFIPNSVTSIGDYAFGSCYSLTDITISDGVISIDDRAFDGCSLLTSITIPASVASIGDSVFSDCNSLAKIEVDANNNSYCDIDGVLYDENVTTLIIYPKSRSNISYEIANGVESIIASAFANCITLESVTIPSSVKSIGISAFRACSSLKSIILPNGVKTIDDWTFYGCEALTEITISDSVTSVGIGAFSGCASIETVYYCGPEEGWQKIEIDSNNDTFKNANILYNYDINNIASGTWGSLNWVLDTEGTLTINGEGKMGNVGTSKVWRQYSSKIKTVVIKDGITSVGFFAFSDCTSLTSVTIPDSVVEIGGGVFHGCTSLETIYYCGTEEEWQQIEIGSYNDYFGNVNIVYDCDAYNGASGTWGSLDWVLDIEGTLTIRGKSNMVAVGSGEAWRQYSGEIKRVVIKDGVTSVGSYAFYGCTSLTSINIPNSVTSLGYGAFIGCTSFTSIKVDVENANYCVVDNVLFNKDKTIIYQYPAGKTDTAYDIPSGVTSVGYNAFNGCTALTSINIPNSVTSIGLGAFGSCTSLTSITIPNSVTSIGSEAFWGCTSLTNIVIPNSVISLGDRALVDCSSLTSVTIPDGVYYISAWAFMGCTSLTSITIPNSVASISAYAFEGCTSLETVYYGGSEGQWEQIDIVSLGNNSLINANVEFALSYTKGDVNGDGEVDNLDAAMILKYDAGIIKSVDEMLADVNNDGEVDNLDAAMILKYDAGILENL